jgi:serine/threonine-protein kinase
LKPENIFLCQQGGLIDFPKVLDFGLAKVTERQMRPGSIVLTQEGMVFGTPEFMSPEQAQGKTLDARSDLYSLAIILYEVLTGKLPFTARTPMEYIQKHVLDPIIALEERVPGLSFPKGLGQVLQKALAKKPEDRYQSAAEFAEALRVFGGAAAQSLPTVQASSTKMAVSAPLLAAAPLKAATAEPSDAKPPTITVRAPAVERVILPRQSRPGSHVSPGLLIGVGLGCLCVGIVLALVVMRFLEH